MCKIKGNVVFQHPKICYFPSTQFYEGKLITKSGRWKHDQLNIWPKTRRCKDDIVHPCVFVHIEGEEKILSVATEEGNEQSRSNKTEAEYVVGWLIVWTDTTLKSAVYKVNFI